VSGNDGHSWEQKKSTAISLLGADTVWKDGIYSVFPLCSERDFLAVGLNFNMQSFQYFLYLIAIMICLYYHIFMSYGYSLDL
jgi:hypothetical protein